MNKQEKIQESYGEHWDIIKDFISENGWYDRKYSNFNPELDGFDISILGQLIRPKSLKGIETNNGWIEYKENGIGYLDIVYTDAGNIYPYSVYVAYSSINDIQKITHHQKIEMPNPPIY